MASSRDAIEAQNDIDLLGSVLEACGANHPNRGDWANQLEHSRRRLADAQQAETAARAFAPQPVHSLGQMSRGAEPTAPVSRKRNLDLTIRDVPHPKRISANPSPQTPSTPDSSNFDAHVKPEWTLQNRAAEAPGSSGASDYIDLTVSDPPSPASIPGLVNAFRNGSIRPDPFYELDSAFRNDGFHPHEPFPELANAYRDDGGHMAPADAMTQEYMSRDELAEFLITPTPPGGGNAFQPQQRRQFTASGEPRTSSEVTDRFIPYLPDSLLDRLGRESDDEGSGDLALSATEAESIEKMLEIVEQNSKDSPEDREQTPRIMSSTLKEYQKIGLTWLLKMEESRNKGGILADEMGLGKTVSTPCCRLQGQLWNFCMLTQIRSKRLLSSALAHRKIHCARLH